MRIMNLRVVFGTSVGEDMMAWGKGLERANRSNDVRRSSGIAAFKSHESVTWHGIDRLFFASPSTLPRAPCNYSTQAALLYALSTSLERDLSKIARDRLSSGGKASISASNMTNAIRIRSSGRTLGFHCHSQKVSPNPSEGYYKE
jgi:hypothetical protein